MVSLLLYQSVCFAASAFVDMSYLQSLGYQTRKEARKDLFRRARLLYDFNAEENRVILAQSALLLSYWYESPNECKDAWYWLGLAINWAKGLGMNHFVSYDKMNQQQSRTWRRIWWSCYTRGRLIALGMHRPMHIRESDFDIAGLSMDDFDTSPLPEPLSKIAESTPLVRDSLLVEMIAKLCLEFTNLCTCINEVLTAQYSVSVQRACGMQGARNIRLGPKVVTSNLAAVNKCRDRLEVWYQNLSHDLRYESLGTQTFGTDHMDIDAILLHRALLISLFFTTSTALYRPLALHERVSMMKCSDLQHLAAGSISNAADHITAIYQDLDEHNLTRFLPNTGVTCLISAALAHIARRRSVDAQSRQDSAEKARFCLRVLQDLSGLHNSAQAALSYLTNSATIRKLSLQGLGILPETCESTLTSSLSCHDPAIRANPLGTSSATAQLLSSMTLAPHELAFLTSLAQTVPICKLART